MSDETKAKDLLRRRELGERRPLGERTLKRVGDRRTSAPGSERRKRIFERLGLADPYDPDARERPITIGAVGLKLSNRRRPAPHARVKDPNKKKPAHPAQAARRPNPKPSSPAPTRAPASPQPAKKKKGGVGEIPDNLPPAIRRRLEAQKAQQLTAGFDRGPAKKPAEPAQPPPEEPSEPGRLPSSLRPGGSSKKKRSPRVRMSRSRSSGGPVTRDLPPPKESTPVAEAEPPPPERKVERRPPPGGDVGLDDLFGFANEGRMRLGRRKKPDAGDSPSED